MTDSDGTVLSSGAGNYDGDQTLRRCNVGGPAPVAGCTAVVDACNYKRMLHVNDGSCTYVDCSGSCHGQLVVDACGECGGDGTACA